MIVLAICSQLNGVHMKITANFNIQESSSFEIMILELRAAVLL
jgi:hypothetical protein